MEAYIYTMTRLSLVNVTESDAQEEGNGHQYFIEHKKYRLVNTGTASAASYLILNNKNICIDRPSSCIFTSWHEILIKGGTGGACPPNLGNK